jgi:PKD repeat protein
LIKIFAPVNLFTLKFGILFFAIFISSHRLSSQTSPEPVCGTVTSTESLEYYNSLKPEIKKYEEQFHSLSSAFGKSSSKITNSIPIQAHIIRNSNGNGGLRISDLNAALSELNATYASAHLQFYLSNEINYINNDYLTNFNKSRESALISSYYTPGVLNIYFFDTVENESNINICGYTNNVGKLDIIVLQNSCVTNGSTLSHEVGHFFSLMHTHGPQTSGLTTELVNGSNCDTDGDGICDTPADPTLTNLNVDDNCRYTGQERDANGQRFAPDTQNMMSYSTKGCRSYFTPQQAARMYAYYKTAKSYLSSSTFNANISANVKQTCDDYLTVEFSNNSVGATSWKWDIDSDGIIDYTTQNPTHTFEKGIYDVTLTVSNKTNTVTKTFYNFIQVGFLKTVPFTEDFDALETANDTGWTSTDVSGNGFNWYIHSGETDSEGTGPSTDNTTRTKKGKYIYTDASGSKPGDVAEFLSPCIAINSSNLKLEFAYHMFGAGIGELHVDIITEEGLINDVIPVLSGNKQKNSKDNFKIQTIDLSAYANQTIKIKFRAVRGSGWDGDIAIDDIKVIGDDIIKPIAEVKNSLTEAKIYPNPVTDGTLNISLESMMTAVHYEISNLYGQVFSKGTLNGQQIDVNHLSSGTYILSLNDGSSWTIKKFIK